MSVRHYKELLVWQRSVDLVALVHRLTRQFPHEEIYTLTAQLRRAAISIPSNIAEGQGRLTTGEFKHFLGIARGSLLEVETQLHIAERLRYVQTEQWTDIADEISQISRMLNALIAALPKPSH
jgi:four helix bundle protein